MAVEKAKSALKVIVPSFNKALENSDDINLLINIESVAKIENITTCFILDKNGKVIIHNNVSEWSAERTSRIYNKAIEQKTQSLQQTTNKDFLLFSEPLISDCTLFCIFSVKEAKETSRNWKIKYYTAASSVALLIVIILYYLSKLFILLPFSRIKKSLENNKFNENIKEKISKKIKILEEDRESLGKIIEYSQETSIKDSSAFIILNSLNRVMYAYDNTGTILKKDFEKGVHILEISENPNLVKIISKANENPGKEINESFENYEITAVLISADGKTAGTIIKIIFSC
ncbi:hypothetical protein AGMMS5026_06180 [Endomicrobiia bacterium]|nr:hypothetical protein AGMMS49523_09890 [Endomicrobiia bacterium]GHT13540.1 hypothetical protein AGMMS49571_07450 [Endomicrobiia bacterium]GHT18921.1 hypothetical protein AGMMS49929_01540 [Endomicrobiia bacterium]GHT30881.1 hypothetical protein AGMMS5026_06180 [Endomicrobiia bacterium]